MAGNAVDFGALVRVSLAVERTFAAWINLDVINGDTKAIIAPFADTGGVMMYVSGDDLFLYSNRHNVAPGAWQTTTAGFTADTWFHVAVSYDHRLTTNDPQMWVNGVPKAVTELLTPAGTLNVELGTHVVVGNAKTVTRDYEYAFDGRIFDARIYNRMFTDADAVTLYNGGTPDVSKVTDGLIFQPFAVLTSDYAALLDTELDALSPILENVYRVSGRVNGNPILRAAP